VSAVQVETLTIKTLQIAGKKTSNRNDKNRKSHQMNFGIFKVVHASNKTKRKGKTSAAQSFS
jgi:hypothetical protein